MEAELNGVRISGTAEEICGMLRACGALPSLSMKSHGATKAVVSKPLTSKPAAAVKRKTRKGNGVASGVAASWEAARKMAEERGISVGAARKLLAKQKETVAAAEQ